MNEFEDISKSYSAIIIDLKHFGIRIALNSTKSY